MDRIEKSKFQQLVAEYRELLLKQNWALILSLIIIIAVADQVTKQYFDSNFSIGEYKQVIGDTVRLTLHKNRGIAFGIELIDNRLLFSIFSLLAGVFIFFYLLSLRIHTRTMHIVIGLIMGGALGNLIDRILFGEVIDFMDVDIPDIPAFDLFGFYFSGMNRWPIFNVADAAVSCGMILIIYLLVKQSKTEKNA
ncbi:MAG: signal peptidase II [Calditrichaeota bacterium]|nr:signal peptidase II [Calditrichota bacterium]